MLDVIYVLATILFFWAMIAYVRGCEALGHDPDTERGAHPMSAENWIGGLISVALFVYLCYTMLRPEKF